MNHFRSIIEKCSQTVGRRTEVDDVTTVPLILQRIFGQQVLDPNWSWKRFYLHHSIILLIFVYVFFGTLETLNTSTDAELVAEAYYTLVMIVVFPIKFLLFVHNRFVFRELYVAVKTTLFETIQENSDYKAVLRKAKTIVYALFAMVIIPATNYELTTLYNYIEGRRILLSRSTATLMPMTTPYYELAWFIHSIFLFEMSTTIILDMWFVLLIYFLCSATDSLGKKLSVEKRRDESRSSYAKRLDASLKDFYESHVKQIQFLNSLNNMYKWLAFVPLCNAGMCICIILLLLSKDVNWRFVPHVLPMFAEIFAYNWFGEQIKTKTEKLNMSLLHFDWTNLDLKDRRKYGIIMMYMKKQFGIKTAIGGDLSLITMSAVLKASYQAFTVLQSVGD